METKLMGKCSNNNVVWNSDSDELLSPKILPQLLCSLEILLSLFMPRDRDLQWPVPHRYLTCPYDHTLLLRHLLWLLDPLFFFCLTGRFFSTYLMEFSLSFKPPILEVYLILIFTPHSSQQILKACLQDTS